MTGTPGVLRVRMCSHPEMFTFPGAPVPEPSAVNYLCACGANWFCPVCRFGSMSHPHVCTQQATNPEHDHTAHLREALGGVPASIRILGIPWQVEFTELVNDERVGDSWVTVPDQALIRIRDDTNHAVRASNLFECVIDRALHLLADEDRHEPVIASSFADVLYGTLRSNPGLLAFCTGWSDEMPTVVNVAGFAWTVRLVDYVPGEAKYTHGMACWQAQTIYIRQALPVDVKRSTLLHEVCHAVAMLANRPLNNDEGALRVIHYTLHDFFRDNPAAVRWIFGEVGSQ